MSNVIVKDGKAVFLGKEDRNNPPVSPRSGSQMECPICHNMFDYLVGENTPDGGRQGCETCYKPGTRRASSDSYDTSKEIL